MGAVGLSADAGVHRIVVILSQTKERNMAKTSFTRAQIEQIAAIARHEVKHEVQMHTSIWNKACDHVINNTFSTSEIYRRIKRPSSVIGCVGHDCGECVSAREKSVHQERRIKDLEECIERQNAVFRSLQLKLEEVMY